MDFKGKHVVITGGAGDIGFEITKQLLMQGAEKICIFDICESTQRIESLKKEYSSTSKTILYVKTDVSKKLDVDNSFKRCIEQFKTIDVFIGSAGICNDQTIEQTINVNFLGIVNTTLKAMEFMSIENGGKGGIIANVSSVAGLVPSYPLPVYTGSKHAVVGFMSALSDNYYYNRHSIDFITICPGLTDTLLIKNAEKKSLFADVGPSLVELLQTFPLNSTPEMAKFIIDILKIGKNGSVWIADKEITEIKLAKYWPTKSVTNYLNKL